MQVKSMKGKTVDMGALYQKNQFTPAIGSANVNARGDKLGQGGKIIKTREQIDAEILAYNRENQHAVKMAAQNAPTQEILTPAEVMADFKKKAAAKPPVDTTEEVAPSAPVNAKTRKISDSE